MNRRTFFAAIGTLLGRKPAIRFRNGSSIALPRFRTTGISVPIRGASPHLAMVFGAAQSPMYDLTSRPGCPKIRHFCRDGQYREFDCCDTGMRSGGYDHDQTCSYFDPEISRKHYKERQTAK